MKKVLIFTPRVSGQRAHYYNSLAKLCDLTVLSELDTPMDTLFDYNVVRKDFQHVVMDGIKFRINSYEALCLNYKKYFKNKIYDCIIIEQVFTPTAFLIMRYLKRNHITFLASADGGIVNHNENIIKFLIKKSFISLPDFWLTSGKGGQTYLNSYGIKNDKIFKFIFSPYCEGDLPVCMIDNIEKNYLRSKLGIREKIVIFSAGQPIYRKGHDILLNVISKLDCDVGVYFAGGGPNSICRKILSSLNKKISSNIHFVGLLDKEKLKEYYSVSDIFVFPSRYDIWGYPIQEAMAFGIPIISSNASNSAIELIVNGENGYLFENENVTDLKQKLKLLLKDDNLREKIRINNFKKSKLYTSENMAKSIYEIITEMENI